ncbi:cytochrome P450 3A2-like [Ixodes scapularis]|nr:cytochrome P450 3A2-like [Ixodes scapularis]
MWALVCTTLIAVISTLFFLWRRHRFSLFKNIGIPGPEPSIFTGNISEIIEKGAARMFDEWVNKYGDVVGFYNGVTPMLIVKDLEMIKNIQIKDFGNFHGRGVTSKLFRNHQVGKLKLINVDGDRWKHLRSLLTPAFTSSNMKKISSVMDACTNDVMEVLDSFSNQDKAFEMGEVYRRFSLDVMLRSAFGVESNIQKNQGITGVNEMLEQIADHEDKSFTGWLPFLFNCYPEFSFIWKLYFTWSKYFISFPMDKLSYGFMPVINMRRSNPEARRDDLLQLMLNAETEEGAAVNVHKLTVKYDDDVSKPTDTNLNGRRKRVLSNAEVHANAQVFLIAGTETSRTALTFTSYLLAKFQDVQDRLRTEITAVLERDGKFSYDNVFSMRYLDQVISESLRFYPPVTGFITRTCQHDYEYNGLKIPAGISVLIPPYQLHHDPNLWTEPEKFDPERFSAENKGSFDPMAFQPFGNGPRNCVGLRFAQLEMKLTLAKMLAKYRFLLDERHVKEDSLKIGSTFIFCYPQEGAWLKVEKI